VQDGLVTNIYSPTNSLLELSSLGNGNTCISAVEYDENGNLWMLNGYSLQPLKVRLSDGTWKGFETGTDSKNVFTGKLAIDYNGNKWFGIYGTGLVGYDDNGTPETPGDDSYKTLTTGEGLGNLPSENVTAIAVDFDNEIWIGTEAGFGVLYNSDGIFSGSNGYDASRILITYEGNVEYLLGSTSITDIEIDGGNRKWIATASNGIFMLSADGQQVLAEYTKENSPLISNNIMDMEFNQVSGELFIITDLGMVSMRVDASFEDETYESTTVFPNPVKPDYFGPVTIQGIRYDSDVKITDVAGNLVYKTTSNGGTATWNGKTINGEDVASGVYLIWTATNTGKSKKVGKVTVIR
ncbi:MAG: ABC transporter substrate-binding protein, partial [Flavobacteriia bacterium]|nr:ABC transporter substrate-binding protein [Flavobacteriia bacterium]